MATCFIELLVKRQTLLCHCTQVCKTFEENSSETDKIEVWDSDNSFSDDSYLQGCYIVSVAKVLKESSAFIFKIKKSKETSFWASWNAWAVGGEEVRAIETSVTLDQPTRRNIQGTESSNLQMLLVQHTRSCGLNVTQTAFLLWTVVHAKAYSIEWLTL